MTHDPESFAISLRVARGLVCAMVAASLLTSCGGNRSTGSSKLAEARFVTLANALCRIQDLQPRPSRIEGKRFLAYEKADLEKLHTLVKASSGLARVGTYISDLDKRKKLLSKFHTGFGGKVDLGSYPWSLFTDAYQLNVKIFDDEKALGLVACLGSPPRPPIGG
jgi:hypothetical protein